ncbi:hypothetical protein SSX86_003401 [Deinandra increscens subsp. villosa]|uniref:ATP-dependent DNA helicase n=1 Tax=Deinandra increscens subsp. villosa TaxID=3103831 RepID=A0AAP0DLQ7_9ASTR
MHNRRRRSRESFDATLGSLSSTQARRRANFLSRRSSVPSLYIDCGDCTNVCSKCLAKFWDDEKLTSSPANGPPKYNQCCKNGTVRFPFPRPPPVLLRDLLLDSHFQEYIRGYNSMFSMTSFGANVDDEINDGPNPYVFKVEGQICHRIGSLCPTNNRNPVYLQLYIYDTENEVANRLRIFNNDNEPSKYRPEIVTALLSMLESNNEFVKLFRTARDLCNASDVSDFSVCLFNSPRQVSYDIPSPGCIGAIVLGDDSSLNEYDIILHLKDDVRKRISKLHPSYMPLQYPLLFPYGDTGWSREMKLRGESEGKQLTMNMFYSYQLHDRQNVYSLILRSGRLLQQYIVDAYVCIEQSRLDYIRDHQNYYRSELLRGVHDAVLRGDTEGQSVGKRMFLPSSFTGGPRYMYKHYQDALAICRVYGNPQYFITFTCNSNWPEIQRYISQIPSTKSQNRPEMVSRVFRMKVNSLVSFLKNKKPFGTVTAHLYTIEFQKRGLPHCHLLLWVEDMYKIHTPEQIDKYISAEIPNPNTDQELYKIVSEFMIHGPCGYLNRKATCMASSETCAKKFPKDYIEETVLDTNGYAHYKRTASGFTVIRNGISIDNGFVVPYNRTLSLHFCAHINVEYCGWSMLIKYLFKYISKGADRIRFTITRNPPQHNNNQPSQSNAIDEIKNFQDGRFICAYEASWRILNFPIHERNPAVQVLAVHLENLQSLTFKDSDRLEYVANNPFIRKTTLTEWLQKNRYDPSGRHLRYVDYLKEFRWDASARAWIRRAYHKTPTIGRLTYVHPTCGETFYLRMLLFHQVGCQSYEDIRTVSGQILNTYRAACEKLGLLGNDREWLDTLEEASFTSTSIELRTLFTHMLLYCNVTNPVQLWNEYWHKMSDDITYRHGYINPEDLKQYVLYEIELLLRSLSPTATLSNYDLPLPKQNLLAQLENRLLMEEKNYDRVALSEEHEKLKNELHSHQRLIYDYVIDTLQSNKQVLAFVYGHGGTGKTFLWKTIICALRSKGDIVLAVAASGIASLLLPGGRTAHSRFRLPIDLTKFSTYNISKNTNLAKLLIDTKLIIWDEAPMSERKCLESLDRTLKDLLDTPNVPFGGKSLLLGGDFRQTLPVKQKATKSQILEMSLPRSPLWIQFKIFRLTENLRLRQPNLDPFKRHELTQFSAWLLDIGNGTINIPSNMNSNDTKIIEIPNKFLIPYTDSALQELITYIYDNSTLTNPTAETLSQKAIVCPKNETVDEINDIVLKMTSGNMTTYFSTDTVVPHVTNEGETEILYPTEYLNSLQFSGLPPHRLELKKNTPIILLRNINQSLGLCNGTRLIVSQPLHNVIEAHIITGTSIGKRVYIPRITLTHNDKELPFYLKRKQFPVKVCYAMTINKSQGQSLSKIGIYLPHPPFGHGQLYVALSRATSSNALKILITPNDDHPPNCTKNVVYSDFLAEIERTIHT